MGTVGVRGHSASSSNPFGRVGVLDCCRRKCNPDRNARNKDESHKRSLVYTCHRQASAGICAGCQLHMYTLACHPHVHLL